MEQKNEWYLLELKELFIRQELSGVPLPQTVILYIECLAGHFVQEASRRKEIEVWEEAKEMIEEVCDSEGEEVPKLDSESDVSLYFDVGWLRAEQLLSGSLKKRINSKLAALKGKEYGTKE